MPVQSSHMKATASLVGACGGPSRTWHTGMRALAQSAQCGMHGCSHGRTHWQRTLGLRRARSRAAKLTPCGAGQLAANGTACGKPAQGLLLRGARSGGRLGPDLQAAACWLSSALLLTFVTYIAPSSSLLLIRLTADVDPGVHIAYFNICNVISVHAYSPVPPVP